jgi:hypothetical protein
MASQLNDAENLSRIREILLGSEIEEVEKRVQLVKDEISQIVQQFESDGQAKHTEIQQLIDQKVRDLEQLIELKNTDQEGKVNDVKEDIKEIRQSLEESFAKLNQQMDATSVKFHQMNTQNLQMIEDLKLKWSKQQAEIGEMKKAKMDKKRLADLMAQLSKELLTDEQDDK